MERLFIIEVRHQATRAVMAAVQMESAYTGMEECKDSQRKEAGSRSGRRSRDHYISRGHPKSTSKARTIGDSATLQGGVWWGGDEKQGSKK